MVCPRLILNENYCDADPVWLTPFGSWRVSEVKVIEDHAVWVRFKDGLEGVVRFLPGFFRGVFSHLSDPAQFRLVTVVGGAVTWPGELDLAPDAMHEEIKLRGGVWVVEK